MKGKVVEKSEKRGGGGECEERWKRGVRREVEEKSEERSGERD